MEIYILLFNLSSLLGFFDALAYGYRFLKNSQQTRSKNTSIDNNLSKSSL
jgi:hypothetical protein